MPKHTPDRIPISVFKAKSLALLERVRRTGRHIIVTKRGEPIAEVIPPSIETLGADWIGSASATATIRGNLIEPAGRPGDWEALG